MTDLRRILAVLGLSVLAVAPSLGAQSLQTVRTTDFSAAAGVSFPQGDMGEGLNTGFIVAGAVNLRPVNMPVGFRVEALYTRFGTDSYDMDGDYGSVKASGNVSMLAGSGNVVLGIPTASAVRPYLIGGLGLYHIKGSVKLSIDCPECEDFGNGSFNMSDSENKFGLNAGGGVEFRMGTLRSFVEARFHSVFTEEKNANFIPITVGVRF